MGDLSLFGRLCNARGDNLLAQIAQTFGDLFSTGLNLNFCVIKIKAENINKITDLSGCEWWPDSQSHRYATK